MSEQPPNLEENLKRLESVLWRTLPLVMHASRSLARRHFSGEQALTPGQYHTLRNIHRGTKSVRELADCEKVSPPAVSRYVDDLVNMDLLERSRDPEDRRSIILALTEKGQNRWDNMVEQNHRYFSEKMKRLSAEELKTIIKGLELLYSVFSEQPLENNCQTDGGIHHNE